MEDVAGYYEAKGLLARVDGRQSIDDVTASIRNAIAAAG
jgi:adenylate kinase family enzyme